MQRDIGMASGKVKWFNNAKGYGFINEDGKTDDLFAHYSAIQMDGYKTLKAGQAVTFEIVQGPKGLHATQITNATAPVSEFYDPSVIHRIDAIGSPAAILRRVLDVLVPIQDAVFAAPDRTPADRAALGEVPAVGA